MIFKLLRTLRNYLRVSFFAGMFIAVPFGVTVAVMVWLWGKVNTPLMKIFSVAVTAEDAPWYEFGVAIENSDYHRFLVPLVSASLVLAAVLILGMLTRSIIGRMMLAGFEGAVARMPVVGVLYTSFRQFSEAFSTVDGESKFQRVVAVQFPYKGSWSIGFVTGKAALFMPPLPQPAGTPRSELLSVIIPSTPFPTTSFMIVVPENETVKLDMPVKQALKLVISGGIISPGESRRTQPESELDRIVRESAKLNLKAPVGSENAKPEI